MSEALLSKKVLKSLLGLDPMPVDNPRKPGTPDINFIEGWLELKHLHHWPKRAKTKVKIKSWTKKQMIWHYTRTSLGGKSWVLLQVGTDYLLFSGYSAAVYFNESSQSKMRDLALVTWVGYPGEHLCKYLK
jgi:hypothetical protein